MQRVLQRSSKERHHATALRHQRTMIQFFERQQVAKSRKRYQRGVNVGDCEDAREVMHQGHLNFEMHLVYS